MFHKFSYILLTCLLILASCKDEPFVSRRDTIFLNGLWKFSLDTSGIGIAEKWYALALLDSVKLPGTLDENKKGIPNNNRQETMRLSREMMYAGIAWYQKEVNIP